MRNALTGALMLGGQDANAAIANLAPDELSEMCQIVLSIAGEEFVEQCAKDHLGMVRKDEYGIEDIGGAIAFCPASTLSDQVQYFPEGESYVAEQIAEQIAEQARSRHNLPAYVINLQNLTHETY